jgi:hypothetical protein
LTRTRALATFPCVRSALPLAALIILAGCGDGSDSPRDGGLGIYDGGLGGLGGSGGGGGGGFAGDHGGGPGSREDADQDGVCDGTEESIGSSSDTADSDGDGLPDLIELIYGFTLTDPLSPSSDRLVRLEARGNAQVQFPVRFTVEGESSDFIGFFEDSASPYDDGSSAGRYLESSVAIAAEPPEAARVVDGARQRFLAVLGTARLELEVRFTVPSDEDAEGCARVYPFRYGIREDGEGLVEDRLYLLVVAPAGGDAPEDFCQPLNCF